MDEWIEILNNQSATDSELAFFSLSSKCKVLFNILYNELERVGRDKFKTLILVQRRKVAQILSILINQSPLPLIADFLVSSISKGGGMNCKICPSQQKERLSRFYINDAKNEDRIDILVATSLLEEGIDIPSCKLVIKFNETMSSKQDVQCKGRARHAMSRYIHLIHEKDELRQTEKLKKYKDFQEKVVEVNDDDKKEKEATNSLFDVKDNDILDAKAFDRGLFVEETEAFLVEKCALTKLHEIYNRHDFELNCDVPWESFAESPFSKQNFEQSIYSGICGLWKINEYDMQYLSSKSCRSKINDINDGKRLTIKRMRNSDDTMEGTFYITNDEYEENYQQYRIQRRENERKRKKNRFNSSMNYQRAESPELPDKFGEVEIMYKDFETVHIEFTDITKDNNEMKNVFVGKISEDRNNIKVTNDKDQVIISLSKLENVTSLNKDPNAFACNC